MRAGASGVPIYRLFLGNDGETHIEPLAPEALAFENGPGPLKGVGGTVLGRASWVTLMRFEEGVRPGLHRVNPGLAVLLEGRLEVGVSDGAVQPLVPGDALRIEHVGTGRGQGGWAPANPGPGLALLALVQMPTSPSPPAEQPPP